MKTSDIIAVLPTLPLKDLRIIQSLIDKELSKHLSLDKDLYFMLFQIIGETPIKPDKFIKSDLGSHWINGQLVFDKFVNKLLSNAPARQTVVKAIRKFLIEILVEDIKIQGKPLNMRNVCFSLGNIEAAFDRAFPGYLNSGLSHLIIKRIGGNHE